MGTTMQHPRPWLLPLPQRIICAPLSRLPGHYEQDEVDHDGQGDAQYHAHPQPEKASSSHRLEAFRAEAWARGARGHLRLEEYLFQDRFQVAHDPRLPSRACPSERLRQPRKTDIVFRAQRHAYSVHLRIITRLGDAEGTGHPRPGPSRPSKTSLPDPTRLRPSGCASRTSPSLG
jgi:hypothetical protein